MIALKPDWAEAHLYLGNTLLEQGKPEQAIESYQKVIALKPDWADAHWQLGSLLLEQGNLEVAIDSYQKVIALKPEWADAHWQLGVALLKQGRPEQAIESYQKAVALKPDWAEAYWQIGGLLLEQRKPEQGIENYRRAIAIYENIIPPPSDLSQLHLHLGNILLKQNKLQEAFKNYEQALEIQPDLFDEIIVGYRTLISTQPELPELHLDLIKLFVNQKYFSEAYQSYQRLKGIDSKLASGAIEIYQKVIASQPNVAELYLQLGNILLDQNKLDEACQFYERAIEIQPDLVRAHLQLGMALRFKGHIERALRCCQRALEIDSNSAAAHYRLADVIMIQGKRDEALRGYYQSNKLEFSELRAKGKTGGICFFPLQRSGSLYINYALSNGLAIPFASDPSVGSYNTIGQYLVQTSLETHRFIDCITTGHVSATQFNLLLLNLYIDKMIVHVRDPRQVTLSMIHYFQTLWRQSPTFSLAYSFPDNYFSLSLTEQISWQIENWCLPGVIKWIEGWLDADEDPLFNPNILFTRHEDLAANPDVFFESILSFYNIERSRFTFPKPPDFKHGTHNRKGSVDEWREVFTPEQAEKASSMIPDRLLRRFGWPAR